MGTDVSNPVELRLAFESDLNEAAIEEAIHLLKSHVDSTQGIKADSYSLRVGFWTSELALQLMAKYKSFDVSVYRGYAAYAWELHHNFNPVYVRSDGA